MCSQPLGPDSLTWRYFGDWRGMLQGPWAGSMQNMHPGLGAAVTEHSTFELERWQRVMRSLYPIGGVVFDGARAADTAARIRRYHNDIGGVDAQGRRYHALDPDTFYWAHATFYVGTLRTAECFMGGLTEAQHEQLFAEHRQWYALYGMSMRPVPATRADFQRYWDHMCREVLEDTPAARVVLDLSELPRPPFLPWLPARVWALLRPAVARSAVRLTVGLYDPSVRELLGYSWSEADEHWFRRVCRAVELAFRLVPARRRMHPRARAGVDRATGRLPTDAPLPETPDRNLPLPDRRNSPRHYVPGR
ncbi:oxygenase MpaB family protein [Rhodococcoides corynebacterioides]|uniref:oxygenase MpaB family protein n=1 Tax=Rhodococcoides corynebacterioides TaxID=53972 RepID=UPI003AEC0C17